MTNPSHYREIEEIGRGGMAAVYKAQHTATKVEVALKRRCRGMAATTDSAAKRTPLLQSTIHM